MYKRQLLFYSWHKTCASSTSGVSSIDMAQAIFMLSGWKFLNNQANYVETRTLKS